MQTRLFPEGTIPECTRPEWYALRERAPHLEQEGQRPRMLRAASYVDEAIDAGARTVVDLGAGDGGMLSLIDPQIPAWGYDLQPSNIEGAVERQVDVTLADILHDPIRWGEVAIATELLEHLLDPEAFVRLIAEHSTWLVASSPAFETEASHYEYHNWIFDQDGYRELVEQGGFSVVRHEIVGGFQVLLARR